MKEILKKIPPFKKLLSQRDNLLKELNEYKKFFPPGHFYSPIPSIENVLKNEKKLWEFRDDFPGINLNTQEQLELLDKFSPFYQEIPFKDHKSENLRYYFINDAYSYSDAIILYCMIRFLKPKNIIEVGSGFSSCVSLDTNELYFDNQINIQFIEPYPHVLKGLIKEMDRDTLKIQENNLQDIPVDFFKQLKSNDILFIDSTHVSKINSDVNYIIHEILPILSNGVYIHFHDVFYPFEYPKEWILEGRAWNEQYILRAFLQFNDKFKIVIFNTYLETVFEKEIKNKFPLLYKNPGGSIWIKKID